MKKKSQTDALSERIVLLQNKQAEQLIILREQFYITYESLKPLNLIKNVLHEVASSPALKNNLLNNVIGLMTGYLSKKVLIGTSHNPIKKILGAFLQFAIANLVSKHSENIKSAGEYVLQRILNHRNKVKEEFLNYEN
jgi:hypothetical protein